MRMIISKSALISDQEFDLDQVKGKVVTSKKVKIPNLQVVVIKELTKVTGHPKHVHVLVELSFKGKVYLYQETPLNWYQEYQV